MKANDETPNKSVPNIDTQRLDCGMDSVLAWRLGEIAVDAGTRREEVGDLIDRGLILRRLLEEKGFGLVRIDKAMGVPSPEPTNKIL